MPVCLHPDREPAQVFRLAALHHELFSSAEALRELHRIHTQLGDLRERLARGPKQVQAREGAVKRFEEALKQAKEEPITKPTRDFDLD